MMGTYSVVAETPLAAAPFYTTENLDKVSIIPSRHLYYAPDLVDPVADRERLTRDTSHQHRHGHQRRGYHAHHHHHDPQSNHDPESHGHVSSVSRLKLLEKEKARKKEDDELERFRPENFYSLKELQDPNQREYEETNYITFGASWKSVSGIIVIILISLTFTSIFTFLTRIDLSLPLTLAGYFLYSIKNKYDPHKLFIQSTALHTSKQSDNSSNNLIFSDRSTVNFIKYWTLAAVFVYFLDIAWIVINLFTSTCYPQTQSFLDLSCLSDQPFSHRNLGVLVVYLSILKNFLLAGLIGLSVLWLKRQTQAQKLANSFYRY